MNEEIEIKFSPPKGLLPIIASQSMMGNKKILWSIGVLFALVFGILAYIALLPLFGKNSENLENSISLLQTFLTILGMLFAVSYAANQKNNQNNPEKFLENFFNNFHIERFSKNFTKSRRSRFSDYKILLKYNKDGETQIGYNLEYDNFFIYSSKEKIEKIARENNLEKFGNSSLWLGENCSGSYNERISQLREYIDFVEKNF